MDQTQPIIQYTTVSDSVYLWVKNAIIQGEFKPGEHISAWDWRESVCCCAWQGWHSVSAVRAIRRSATQSNVWKQRDF